MRNFIMLLSCLILCSLLTGCKQDKNIKSQKEVPIHTVIWSKKNTFNIKDIVNNLQYICLGDTTEESFFSSIDKLIVKNNRIYILDLTGPHSLKVFDIDGKYLHKIGTLGNGPGEYSKSLINFDVTERNDVLLYDQGHKRIMTYDSNGNYINSIKTKFSFNDFLSLKEDKVLLALDIYEKNNSHNKVLLSKEFSTKELAYFMFSEDYLNSKLNYRSFQRYLDKIAYMNPVSDTLHIFDNEGLLQYGYSFDFGNNKLPENLKNDYTEATKQRKNGIYYTYFYETPLITENFILGNIFHEGFKYFFAYNLTNNNMCSQILSPEDFDINNINFPLCSIEKDKVISYLNADMYNQLTSKPEFDEITKKHLENGGTILCIYKLKNQE